MQKQSSSPSGDAGFSLVELLVAMAVTLVVVALASSLLAGSFNSRARENQRTDALADAQRAVNIMLREIANSGFGLSTNGIVHADSGTDSIRVRANLNAFEREATSNSVKDIDEDIRYVLHKSATESYIVRYDVSQDTRTTILANRIDSLVIRYYADKVAYAVGDCNVPPPSGASEVTQKGNAKYLVVSVCVELPAQGRPNTTGYQPPSTVQLVSGVTLRNSDLVQY